MEFGEEEEEFSKPSFQQPSKPVNDDEEYEYEYEYDDDEDEGQLFALRHKPVFISKVILFTSSSNHV